MSKNATTVTIQRLAHLMTLGVSLSMKRQTNTTCKNQLCQFQHDFSDDKDNENEAIQIVDCEEIDNGTFDLAIEPEIIKRQESKLKNLRFKHKKLSRG